MPYNKLSDLPDSVKDNLPKHAQEIYKEAFNSAWEQYKDASDRREGNSREATAHRVAWSAVGNTYEKDDSTGKWKKKAE
jgi:cation transport regulator